MLNNFIKRLLLFICCFVACYQLQAQAVMEMNVETVATAGHQSVLDLTVELKNSSQNSFKGSLKITTPKGFTNISSEETEVDLKSDDRIYVPLKIVKGKGAAAGTAEVMVELFDKNNQLVLKKSVKQQVAENNAMSLQAVSPTVFLTNVNDSLSVKVNVSNLGNRPQQVFVVFSIPQTANENGFFEQTAVIGVAKDSVFDFKFWVSKSILEKSQFTVNVAAMRGTEKTLFGSVSVNVQNVSSVKRYEDVQSTAYSNYYQKNSITGSFRTSGKNSGVYQLLGSGDIDLAAGYLSVSGNIYKADNQNQPLVSNSYLAYHLDNHQVKVGNISQPMEVPLFGRGIQFETADKTQNNQIQIGFIDENFNLTEKNAFLERGYGLYALGTLGANNPSNQKSFNYVFKEDKIEGAKHHVLGLENIQRINNDWNVRMKAHGAFSIYARLGKNQPSFAVETQYNGLVKNTRLSGNYFVSSSYFPGNRRGVVQLQQNFMRNLKKERSVYASIFYSDFAPESYTYNLDMKTTSFRLDAGISLPRIKSVGSAFGTQYQTETGNSFSWIVPNGLLGMQAFRITENFNWLSSNQKHSVIVGIEEGLVKLYNNEKFYPQLKINSIYSFKGFNAAATYQHGSFFLSEYASLLAAGRSWNDFRRISLSVATDYKFFSNKLFVRSGAAYLNDFISGETPSAFLNMQYFPTDKYRLYVNSSWFHYNKNSFISNPGMFVIEAGVTVSLGGKAASAGRKGTFTSNVFYDKNGNDVFDEDDEPAADFFVTIDKTTFKTDAGGNIQYKNLPFGTYRIQPALQNGWFAEGANCIIDKYSSSINIALHQNGSVKGKISYSYNEKTVKNFDMKTGGIVFNITKDGSFVQRIVSNDDGNFVVFLPTGEYEIAIDIQSLPENTFCNLQRLRVIVVSGKITPIKDFVIEVKQKEVKVKKFGS